MKFANYKSQMFFNSQFNIVNFLSFKKNKLDFLSKISEFDNRATKFSVGHENLIFIKHPNDIKALLLLDNKSLDKSTPAYDGLRRYLGNGLLSSKNKDWSVHRKIANPFFQSQKINEYFPKFKKIVNSNINNYLDKKSEKQYELNLWVSEITLSILGETILGMSLNKQSTEISLSINKIFETTIKEMYHPIPPIQEIKVSLAVPFLLAKKKLKKIINTLIRENLSQSTRNNYISHLLDHHGENGKKLSNQQIFDEIITMIQAGHETSSNALIWTLIHLQNSQKDKDYLINELQQLPDDYSIEDLESLEFLNACLLETLRLDPPAWAFDRRVTEDIEINGLRFKRNEIVVFSPYFTHRLNSFWNDPNNFLPERFLNKEFNINDAYFPFGFGPRVCIGQRFALIELKTILVEIFRRIKINIISPENIKREGSITLRPDRKIFFNIEKI